MRVKQRLDSIILSEKKEASVWDEAYPIGNGALGAMVFGGVKRECLSLNHDTFWSGYPKSDEFRAANEGYLKARALMREGKYIDAENTLRDEFTSYSSEAYLPLGDMILDFEYGSEKIKGYKRRLDLSKALCSVEFSVGGTKIRREYLASHPENALAIRITSEGGKFGFSASISSKVYSMGYADVNSETLSLVGEAYINSIQNRLRTERTNYFDKEHSGLRFFAGLKLKTDGETSFKEQTLTVKDASYAELFLAAETSFEGFDKEPRGSKKDYCKQVYERLASALGKGYEAVRARHIKDYKKYFDRLKIDLGTAGLAKLSTKERMLRFERGELDPALPALLFNYGRYLTIAASREGTQPMNLQGIWNPDFDAPWNSNYTVNINLEMNYFPTLAANLSEMYKPLLKMAEEMTVTGRKTAEVLYRAPGWVCHHNSDLWRHTQPVMGEPMWSFWSLGSGWICHALYEYYEYKSDRRILEKIYPILEGAAEFYLSQLETLPDGSRALFPSTSPENMYLLDGKAVAVSETTEMTMAIIRELFANVALSAEKLGIKNEITDKIKAEIPLLRQPQIGFDGRLLEWYGEREESEVTHRHVSHLYGLHPAYEISPEKTPELAEACRKTLEVRGDEGTGWSLAWKANFHARLRNGERAYKLICRQLELTEHYGLWNPSAKGGSYVNLFCAHPPFQIDGNFGALSAMLEMLVQSSMDEVHICPAVPSVWQNISVKGIRAKGGRTVSFSLRDGELSELEIQGSAPARVTFKGKDIN